MEGESNWACQAFISGLEGSKRKDQERLAYDKYQFNCTTTIQMHVENYPIHARGATMYVAC